VITALLIFSAILAAMLCYIFLFPFYLEIDTTIDLYRLRFHHFGSFCLRAGNDTILLEMKILNWKKQIDLLSTRQNKQVKTPAVSRKRNQHKTAATTVPWKRIINVLRSFRINRCRIAIDTGNVQINALLYPIFYVIQVKAKKDIQINFLNKNEIILEVENSLARMSWAYLSAHYK
jgi:hypothetical protein